MPIISKKGTRIADTDGGKGKKTRGKRPMCSAVIVAAGTSRRMGGEDKLLLEICGAPVLAHTLTAFQRSECIDEIIIVTREDMLGAVGEMCEKYGADKAAGIIVGGATRLESALYGTLAVSKNAKLIAIHDGARPCLDEGLLSRAVKAASEHYAAAPAIPVSSTIKRVKDGIISETVDRAELVEIQTPQVFDAGLIKAALTGALKKGAEVTDDCMAVELIGGRVLITEGSASNIKITTKDDIAIAESILRPSEQSPN